MNRNKKEMKSLKEKKNAGITLIALVVTLVVLLLLAGITIYAVFSPNRNYYQCT